MGVLNLLMVHRTYHRGLQALREERWNEAADAFRAVVRRDPQHYAAHYYLGSIFAHWENYGHAVDCFRKVIELRPDFADAHHYLGWILSQQGFHDRAHDELSQAISLRPNVARFHVDLGNNLCDLDRYPEAIDAYREAIRLDFGSADARQGIGSALSDLGHWDEAIPWLQEAVDLDPSAVRLSSLGLALLRGSTTTHSEELRAAQLEKAETVLRRALAVDPSYADAAMHLGGLLVHIGRHEEAVNALRTAMSLSRDDTWTRTTLITALAELERTDEALDLALETLRRDPVSAEAYAGLAIAHMALGEVMQAVASFDEALRRRPDYTEAHAGRGAALHLLGRHAEALEAFNQALQLDSRCLQYDSASRSYYESSLNAVTKLE